jgi:hypothetical protein
MSAQLMTAENRVAALRRFGYSDQEASFLCLCALHSGYFLRRQFAHFVGKGDGGTVTEFVRRVLAFGHARSSTWRQNTQLYHLCARPFYHAIGEPDNRHRRRREWMQAKNKIMGFDFVLAHRGEHFLATEREKLAYFADTSKIDLAKLPSKLYRSASDRDFTSRYFVDKYPIFVNNAPDPHGSQVSFCFVDEGLVSLSRFESYLALYRPLFQSLPNFQLIYVADTTAHFKASGAMFQRFQGQTANGSSTCNSIDIEELLTYFRLRDLYERRKLDGFDRSQLLRLRNGRETFSKPEIDALYLTWQAHGDAVLRERLAAKTAGRAPIRGTFSTELLTHDYRLFGHFLLR